MLDLKTLVFFLLNGGEVVITDYYNNNFKVVLEKIPEGVDSEGETTLLIRSERLKEQTPEGVATLNRR